MPSTNVHAPSLDIQNQFVSLEWVGKRWTHQGKTYLKAKHRTMGWKLHYCFEDNMAWFPNQNAPYPILESELRV
jgi:hypothetical protein